MRSMGTLALLGLAAALSAAPTEPMARSANYPLSAVTAASAVIMDASSGKVLWQRNMNQPRYPASTTKVMTALLLLENTLPTDIITAPKDIDKVGESSMHLKPGERVSARDMLYALMLRSANDGCVAVADHISGSVPEFVKLMNARAAGIGCRNTTFNNPNGLNDDRHMTSAYDLALIAREAMRRTDFRQAVRTQKYKITRSINKADQWMVSRNKWLAKDPTADGIKTGYTVPAGHCFVGSATRNGFRLITVVMHSQNWQADHQYLLKYGYLNFLEQEKWRAGEEVGSVTLTDGAKPMVGVFVATNGHTIVQEGSAPATREVIPVPDLKAPIKRKQHIADWRVTDADGFTQTIPLYATEDIEEMRPSPLNGGTLVMGAVACGGVFWIRRRSRRSRRYAHF